MVQVSGRPAREPDRHPVLAGVVRETRDLEPHALLVEPAEVDTRAGGPCVEHEVVAGLVHGEIHVEVVDRLVLTDIDHDRERIAGQDGPVARPVRADDLHLDDLGLPCALLRDEPGIGHAEQHVTHLAHDLGGHADRMELAVVQHRGSVADLGHGVERVRHEDDRPTLALELAHAVQALGLEGLVAHREHLVDQEHVGLHVHRDREPEPDEHARRVELHLGVDELLQLRERDDVVERGVGLLARQTEERRVQVDVLAPRELGMEPGTELEQRREAATLEDRPRGRAEDPGYALQQRRLARAVVPDQAERRALPHLERDVAERPEVLGAAARGEQTLLERGRLLPVDAEALGDVADLDRGRVRERAHSSSAKSPEREKK